MRVPATRRRARQAGLPAASGPRAWAETPSQGGGAGKGLGRGTCALTQQTPGCWEGGPFASGPGIKLTGSWEQRTGTTARAGTVTAAVNPAQVLSALSPWGQVGGGGLSRSSSPDPVRAWAAC